MKTTRRSIYLASSLVVMLGAGSVAARDGAALRYDMNRQPLSQALKQFSQSTAEPIIFTEDLVQGLDAPPLQGTYTSEQALEILLAGTSLTIERARSGAIMVRPKTAARRPQGQKTGGNRPQDVSSVDVSDVRPVQTAAAQASQAPASPSPDAAPLEEMVVTGSLLSRSDANSASPISIITADEILESGSLSLVEVLKTDPSMGPNSRGETLTINGAGASNVNLRNLGSRRTLAMVNGRRLPLFSDAIGNSGQDTTVVPAMMLERVEVLRDGASTIYGADAVAGVVNFILREKYDGFQVEANYGISDRGDGQSHRFSAMAGHSFERGSFIVSGLYQKQEPIGMSERSFTSPIIQTLALPVTANTYGSAFTPGGQVFGPGALTLPPVACYTFSQGVIANPFDPRCPRYNLSVESSLIGGSSLRGLGLVARYDLTDDIEFRSDLFHTRRESYTGFTGFGTAQIDTSALTGAYQRGFVIPATNSNNPYGVDVRLRWRPATYGRQETLTTSNLTYVSAGLSGELMDRFSWDVSHTYTLSDATPTTRNLINSVALFNLLNPTACAASPSCAPIGAVPNIANLLSGATRLTDTQRRYLFVDGTSNNQFSTQQTIATVSTELFTLPGGDARLALGFEHREEDGDLTPDPLTQSGDLIGRFVFPTRGSFSTNEGFGELDLPLLSGVQGAEELTVNLQGRYSDFSNFGGADTYKAGVNYVPVEGLRFRAAYGTSIRAPDVMELFRGGSGGGAALTDPCNFNGLRATNPQVAANCAALGVPGNFLQSTAGSLQIRNGGNPALVPERGRTYTVGVVLQPQFLPDFTATVDYYKIKIRDAITGGNTQTNLNACYGDANLVRRAADPNDICFSFATRLPGGSLDRILAAFVNAQQESTSGVDMNFNYVAGDLGPIPGSLTADLRMSYQRDFFQQGVDLSGTLVGGVDGSQAFPKWRGYLTTTYSISDFDFQWQVEYIDAVRDRNLGTSIPVVNLLNYSGVPDYFEHKLLVRWQVLDDARISVGVNNVFDKQPPYALVTTRNSLAALHDQIGRYFFMTVKKEF